MNKIKKYYYSTEGNSIDIYEISEDYEGVKIHFGVKIIALIILCTISILFSYSLGKSPSKQIEDVNNNRFHLYSNGFVFGNSNNTLITEMDLETLKYYPNVSFEALIDLSINEIYARHGYDFQKDFYSDLYNQFSWYVDIDKKDVSWEDFTPIEKENLCLLISVAKDLGIR